MRCYQIVSPDISFTVQMLMLLFLQRVQNKENSFVFMFAIGISNFLHMKKNPTYENKIPNGKPIIC